MTPGRRPVWHPFRGAGRRVPGGGASRARSLLIVPTPRGWGVLTLGAVCWLTWAWIGLREMLLLAVFLLVPVPLALAAATGVAFLSRPRVVLDTVPPTPMVGERVPVRARVLAHSAFLSDAEVLWRWEGDVTRREGRRVDVVRLRPGPGVRTGVVLRPRERGRMRVTLSSLRVTDPLGLARLWLRMDAGEDLLVLPALLAPGELPAALGAFGTKGVRPGSGEPGGNLREYRTGDAPRSIHWKQSARQGHLLVNVPEGGAGTSHRIVLVTGTSAYPGSGPTTTEAFERAVSVAATLATQWAAHGGEVELSVGGPSPASLGCQGASASLRLLAEARPGAGTDPDPESLLPPGCLLVSGTMTGPLRACLSRGGPGVLVLTDAEATRAEQSVPEGWSLASLPAATGTQAVPPGNRPGRTGPARPGAGRGPARTGGAPLRDRGTPVRVSGTPTRAGGTPARADGASARGGATDA